MAWISALTALGSQATAQNPDKPQAATLRIEKVITGRDGMTVTLSIRWREAADHLRADAVTVLFLFQDEKPPFARLQLDADLPGKLSFESTRGTLDHRYPWVERKAIDYPQKRSAVVVQVIGTDRKGGEDFRRGGTYTLRLPRAAAPAVSVGLYLQTEPGQRPVMRGASKAVVDGQYYRSYTSDERRQTRTSYQLLSNVVVWTEETGR